MTIDANIVIAYLDGDATVIAALSQWRREGRTLLLPTVAETEILSFSAWDARERYITEEFLEQNFTTIPFDRAAARVAAEIRRDFKIKFPDATIAATALQTNTPLITRNVRDFRKIHGLQLVTL